MKDIRIEKLAHNLLTYSIDLKENDNILIEVLGEDGMPLAKELIRQAEQTIFQHSKLRTIKDNVRKRNRRTNQTIWKTR